MSELSTFQIIPQDALSRELTDKSQDFALQNLAKNSRFH
jgi:hypothetical protein